MGDVRTVTVLGSTGSVGANTVSLLAQEPEKWRVEALVANRNVAELARQARALNAALAVVCDESCHDDLKAALDGTGIATAAGPAAVVEAAERPADWVMSAIVGAAGLEPTLAAIRRGALVAFANKETLVCAGDLVMQEVARHGATLLPVDSEHNAIYQALDDQDMTTVERIVLTASGGPFRTFSRDRMAVVTPAQAVAHPNWSMGAKISVDSATMMNKGLEFIEAAHLFPLAPERIDIVVHPQSVIHGMVCYHDGSVLAQLGSPDMRVPISHTLAWPERMATPAPRLDLTQLATLTFEAPDTERFPATDLARAALRTGGAAPTLLNAANEIAVQAFLDGEIGFLDIVATVEEVLSVLPASPVTSLDDVRAADQAGRAAARNWIAGRRRAG